MIDDRTRRRAATTYGLRAAVAAVLGGGLAAVAGSEAHIVGTIAATVVMVAMILTGSVITWFASLARIDAHPRSVWITIHGALMLIVGLVVPVVLFPKPLTDTPGILWLLAGVMIISGTVEVLGRAYGAASSIAGISQVAAALLIALTIGVTAEPYLLAHIGPAGVVLLCHAVALGAAAREAAKRPSRVSA